MFHVGETLLYSNVGHTTYVKVEDIFLDNDVVLRFRVRTKNEELIEATKESLRAPDDPYTGWIPTTIPEKTDAASKLSEDELDNITNPVTLSPLQEEFLDLQEQFWNLPFTVMFRLVKMGFLPTKSLNLTNKALPCVSCLLGQAHIKPWRFKNTNYGNVSSLRGNDISKLGDTIGVDQLISAQPGLVPQEKGIMTRARIWAATVFIDYVTGYVNVGMMQDQSGEATLQAKHNFEHLSSKRDVNIEH